jgi:hypothetical protein
MKMLGGKMDNSSGSSTAPSVVSAKPSAYAAFDDDLFDDDIPF